MLSAILEEYVTELVDSNIFNVLNIFFTTNCHKVVQRYLFVSLLTITRLIVTVYFCR